MEMLFYVTVFLFGLGAGSFLNVCIHRLPRGGSLVHPGSSCPRCGNPIRWYDNIPLVSFVLLRGKCRACGGRISLRYPAVELVTALLMVWLAVHAAAEGISPLRYGVYVYLTLGLVTLSAVDIGHEIIPDEISLVGVFLAPVVSLIVPELHREVPFAAEIVPGGFGRPAALVSSLVGIAVGGGTLWIIGKVAEFILKKEAMGFGDVKLMAMVGGLLGWLDMLLAFFIACGLGSVVGVAVMLRTKSRRIPFGPFLAAGTFLVIW